MQLSRLRSSALLAVSIASVLLAVRPASAAPAIAGLFSGTVRLSTAAAASSASGTLNQSGRSCSGTMTLNAGAVGGTFAVQGSVRGTHLTLRGTDGAQQLRWRARWSGRRQVWRGPFVVRAGRRRVRGVLALAPSSGGAGPTVTCGADYFATTVMPTVIEPICARCHAPGGVAQAAAFHVVIGDPVTTARSALPLVDPADPLHSRLLAKPRGDVPHGGGRQILPGSPEEQALIHWIQLVTAPTCGGAGGGRGGGTGADLFAASCAGCHGADAAGTGAAPSVRCATRIADAVGRGRRTRMPSFSFATADVTSLKDYLAGLCAAAGRTGSDLYAGNCASCHGATAAGGRNGLGEGGPDIRCSDAGSYQEAVRSGEDSMPTFPALDTGDVNAIARWVRSGFCSGGSGGD